MASYRVTPLAKSDLQGIARYTIKTWGRSQNETYKKKLADCFEKLGEGEVSGKPLSEIEADLFVKRCEHHYIFYLKERAAPAEIIAILHEKMDLMTRLKERL